MARFRLNAFYLISAACSLVLVGYAWLVFLPSFEIAPEYQAIRTVVILLTVLMLTVAAIQFALSVRKEEV